MEIFFKTGMSTGGKCLFYPLLFVGLPIAGILATLAVFTTCAVSYAADITNFSYSPPAMFGEGNNSNSNSLKKSGVSRRVKNPPLPRKKPDTPSWWRERVVFDGVVRGAKTMPAVAPKPVFKEVLFEPDEDDDVLEKQATDHDDIQSYKVLFQKLDSKSALLSLPFKPERKEIDALQERLIIRETAELTAKHPDWKILIRAFSSHEEKSRQADENISMSRAMSVKKVLLERNVDESLIEVVSLGRNTDIHPFNRVDILFFATD